MNWRSLAGWRSRPALPSGTLTPDQIRQCVTAAGWRTREECLQALGQEHPHWSPLYEAIVVQSWELVVARDRVRWLERRLTEHGEELNRLTDRVERGR